MTPNPNKGFKVAVTSLDRLPGLPNPSILRGDCEVSVRGLVTLPAKGCWLGQISEIKEYARVNGWEYLATSLSSSSVVECRYKLWAEERQSQQEPWGFCRRRSVYR